MTASPSSQPVAVGETNVNPNSKISYATTLKPPQTIQKLLKDTLKPIGFIHGEPTVRFTMEEREQFAREEGLHQAVIIKFSYGKPDLSELRKRLLKQFDVKGNYLPTDLFARRSLLSIVTAAGKPIAVDKATQDRTRPSMARVKIILDLLDKHQNSGDARDLLNSKRVVKRDIEKSIGDQNVVQKLARNHSSLATVDGVSKLHGICTNEFGNDTFVDSTPKSTLIREEAVKEGATYQVIPEASILPNENSIENDLELGNRGDMSTSSGDI
ncbi:hypothetical protein MTR67_000485 [Solanum verrucosum]|uniref:Uncharacterized protein n=1 Tax=Solanum verrucosum TaxID=315347 RepID=A0AAF0PNR7_SOLVR|nr:hypothetical protein MTR67_000485 [Solanum verrucosum]